MDRIITSAEKNKKKRKAIIRLAIIVIVFIILAISVSLLLENKLTLNALQIGEVDQGSIETTITASGKLSPLIEEVIVSPVNSKILEAYKKPGDSVEKGEPLLKLELASVETEYRQKLDEKDIKKSKLIQMQVKLDNSISELKMQQQIKEMQLHQLHTDWKSEVYLDSIGASTADKVRRTVLNYEESKLELQHLILRIDNEKKNAEAELNVQQMELGIVDKSLEEYIRLLKDARILSPRKATLTYINNVIGSQVTVGVQLAIVSELTRFKIDSEIAEGHREKLTYGAKALIRIDSHTELLGTIVNISPLITNGIINFIVVPDDSQHPGLRSGLKVDIYVFHGRRQDVLRIPNGAWFSYGKGEYNMWVINGDKAEKRKVKFGESSFDYVEVINGLTKGEKVILSDMDRYKTNESLKINKK